MNALAQLLGRPYTVEVGIRFDDMQMCVHRLGTVFVFIRQTHVGDRIPFACQCLDVSAVDLVEGVSLNVVVEFDGCV